MFKIFCKGRASIFPTYSDSMCRRTLQKRLYNPSLQVLADDILPALERLKRERGDYMEWQAANAKLDRLRRFCVAFQYVEAKR